MENERSPLARSDFLHLTGLTVDRYVSLARRDQLPVWNPESDLPSGKQRRFTFAEAIATVVLLQLVENEGIPIAEALYIVNNEIPSDRVFTHDPDISYAKLCLKPIDLQVFIAGFQYRDETGEIFKGHARGTLVQICDFAAEFQKRELKKGAPRPQLVRMVVSNLSEAYRIVRERAEASGIDFSSAPGVLSWEGTVARESGE